MTIREMRKSLGLSQSEYAAKFGMSKRTLENWEQGRTTPPDYVVYMMQQICELEKMVSGHETE